MGVTSAALAVSSALVAAVAVAAPAAAAGPRTITVQPGQSVQAAVDHGYSAAGNQVDGQPRQLPAPGVQR